MSVPASWGLILLAGALLAAALLAAGISALYLNMWLRERAFHRRQRAALHRHREEPAQWAAWRREEQQR